MAANYFWALMALMIAVPFWISTQQLFLGVIALNLCIITFPNYIPGELMPWLALANVFAFAITLFWRPWTPNIGGQ